MKRKSSLSRRSPMKRGGRVKPVNRARKAKAFARAYGSKARVAFVRGLRCIVRPDVGACAGKIENAHIVTGGMGRKADAKKVVPLCTLHHLILHKYGAQSFERVYRVDLQAEAAHTDLLWRRRQQGAA